MCPDFSYFMQVFLFDRESGMFTQVTKAKEERNTFGFLKVSGDAKYVVFCSSGNLTGENLDGNDEIFLFEETLGTKWVQAGEKHEQLKVRVRVRARNEEPSRFPGQVESLVWVELVEMLSLTGRFELPDVQRFPLPPSHSTKEEKKEPDYLISYSGTEEKENSIRVTIQLSRWQKIL